MSLAAGGVNGSAHTREARTQIAHSKSEEVTVPTEPTATLEVEEQDSSNATV